WADDAAARIDLSPYGIAFRIGALRLGEDDSRCVALAIADIVCLALVRRGAPDTLRVERDEPQISNAWGADAARTLLPHHDSAHLSYLTPSTYDVPEWNPSMRSFGRAGFTQTLSHKLYQGFFVTDPGQCLSLTT